MQNVVKRHFRQPRLRREHCKTQVITKNNIEVVKLKAEYAKNDNSRVALIVGSELYSPEKFVTVYYERQGYKVLFLESIPFHVIFGVYMWLLIEDQSDSRNRIVMFGDRDAFDGGIEGKSIYTFLPDDFGTEGYGVRRQKSIDKHLKIIPENKSDMLWTFDYWIESSKNLRQYLWAHRPDDISRAREVVSILPPEVIRRILRYLIGNYWKRYCGWPDLLVYDDNEFFLVEVKSSADKLSEDQKRWINDNTSELKLPFKLAKIHKAYNPTQV